MIDPIEWVYAATVVVALICSGAFVVDLDEELTAGDFVLAAILVLMPGVNLIWIVLSLIVIVGAFQDWKEERNGH